ncbi:MAG: tetratricopeptide repeat protein [Calditerrivibrio sp.]|nr:tetratricopeptide repeat protein [Calditerrivibrio sp.]MCA1980166.1 tetratricopeptide repeat protein [Calditerrivibrio sp.]
MRLFITAILLIFLTFQLCFAEGNKNYIKEFLRANMLINEGHLKEALPLLEDLNKNVEDEAIIIKLGEVYISLGKKNEFKKLMTSTFKKDKFAKNSTLLRFYADALVNVFDSYDEAIAQMKKGVEYDPSVENYMFLSKLCEQKKNYACSIGAYDKIIEKEKKAEHYYKRGMLYYQLELRGKAITDFENSLNLEKNFMAMLMIAEIYIQDNKTEDAIKYLENAIKEKSGLIIPEYRLAELYRVKGDLNNAVKMFELIVDKVGERENLYVTKQIAGIYFELKNYEKAFQWFKIAEEKNKNDNQIYYYLAVTSELKGDYENAVKYYTEVSFRDPNMTFAKKRLAFSHMKLKNFDKAIEALNKIEKNDIDVDYYRLKSAIFAEKGNKPLQIKSLLEGFDKYPNSEEILMDIADFYEKSKNYDKSEEYLRKLLAINPKNASALNYLGYMLADLGKKLEESYRLISEALAIEPQNPAFLDSMAWVLYKQKRFKEAYEYQKRALKLSPDEKEMIDHMNEIMKELGINKTIKEIIDED